MRRWIGWLWLGLVLLAAAGLAGAQGLESVLSPGKLIEGHAKWDNDCGRCHVRFDPKAQARLCAECHRPIAQDLRQRTGLHGRQAPAPCRDCYTDHKGREARISNFEARRFDHAGTDFALRGRHQQARCECCHEAGRKYREAPSHCVACHREDDVHKGSLGRDCAACHSERDWKERARFDHDKTAFPLRGKHQAARCESCHKSKRFNEAPKDCIGCHRPDDRHEGTLGERCADCHSERQWKPADRFDHDKTGFKLRNAHAAPARACRDCHRDLKHLRGTPKVCESCHQKDDRHEGQLGRQCGQCHGDASWKVPGFDHGRTRFPLLGRHQRVACKDCHATPRYKDAPSTCYGCHRRDDKHRQVFGPRCQLCHTERAWALWEFDHDRHTRHKLDATHRKLACAACHVAGGRWVGANVDKPLNHLPTQAACDTCHGVQSFSGARFSHSGVSPGSCSQCHNQRIATGKPAQHVATTASCDRCHKTSGWTGVTGFDHAGVQAGTCAGCHNGSRATGKPARHVPVVAACDGCHTSFSAWRPTAFNHSQVVVAGQSSSCHSGAYPPADGRPVNHIPYQTISGIAVTNCDTCHKAGFAAWAPARLHSAVSVSTQCAACHSGSFPPAVGKPNTAVHAGVTVCENCHRSTSSWTSVAFAHSAAQAVGTGTCDNCHNGSAAMGKTAGHVPVSSASSQCDACHRSQTRFATAVTMNHAVVGTSTCKSCHSGAYLSEGATGALAKPANHIPEATQLLNGGALDCNACHKSTSSWTSVAMNHNGSQGGGAGWCKGCHQSGTSFLGSMDKMPLTHRSKTPPALDCSESGCHRPLGNKGAAYSKWD